MTDKETRRLEKLKSYDILDTTEDPSFDKLARLAAAICGTPIALVSLIDENRQWFKSVIGLDGVHQTPRSISFCTYTIQGDEVMEIKDTFLDERFMANPLVLGDPYIRFYAGAPLTSHDGHNLGTLCVIDREPNHLSASQIEALEILSEQVVELMELRKVNSELKKAKKLLEDQQQLLIHKARLQTIGELASGVCHQINNPLAIIVGKSMILRSKIKDLLPNPTEILKELDVVDQTSQRISEILRALRMYSKDLGQEVAETDVQSVVDGVVTLLRNKIMKEKIELKLEGELHSKVKINKNQISQVLMDVLTNSIEALSDAEDKNLKIDVKTTPEKVILRVEDTGKGIKIGDEEKIFRPFYTTKATHFGVGLSNAADIMKQHNGELRVLQAKNPTIFEIQIPVSA